MKTKSTRLALWLSCLFVVISVASILGLHSASINNGLLEAARRGNLPVVQQALHSGANVNAQDKFGDTSLIAATRQDRPDIAICLIETGANVNACNRDGQTPLMNAVQFGYVRVVQALLAHGALVNAADYNSNTVLSLAAGNGNEEIVALLLKHDADMHDGYGDMALGGAEPHPRIIAMLRKAQAQQNMPAHQP